MKANCLLCLSLIGLSAVVCGMAQAADHDPLSESYKAWAARTAVTVFNDTHNTPPPGFVALFNGKDLTGWKGLLKPPLDNPYNRAKATPADLAEAEQVMRAGWHVEDGVLIFNGHGRNLCTAKDYGDFEMYVDWKIKSHGDSGIYLRGSPQVQIWDPNQWHIGSGGLYNNFKPGHPSNPLKPGTNLPIIADNPIGQWNRYYIKMVGQRVSVVLNGQLVTDNVVMDNYWDTPKKEKAPPIFSTGTIELQNHGDKLWFKNIYVRELPRK